MVQPPHFWWRKKQMKDQLYDAYTQKINQVETDSGTPARILFSTSCLMRILAQIDIYGSIRPADVLDIMDSSAQMIQAIREPTNADI